MDTSFETVAKVAYLLDVSRSTVLKWIRTGKLAATMASGQYSIPDTKENAEFILKKVSERWARPAGPYVPIEIRSYESWHQALDELCWLLKVSYSSNDTIKKKQFRSDQLLYTYLERNRINLKKIAYELASNRAPKTPRITDDMKRGWYNELAYASPRRESVIGLSFKDVDINKRSSSARLAFPSWRIVTAYYAMYFYLRSVTLQKFDRFRLEEHGATLACFKSSALPSLQRCLWKFPLDISYMPSERSITSQLHGGLLIRKKYTYFRHPRTPCRTPVESYKFIRETIKKLHTKRKMRDRYTIFDYMHDFRIWANYLNIDDLLSLHGAGYKAILDQNLALILFFVGTACELAYLAKYGERRYLSELQGFYNLIAQNDSLQRDGFAYSPMFQRSCIYIEAGMLTETIHLERKPDFNRVNLGL